MYYALQRAALERAVPQHGPVCMAYLRLLRERRAALRRVLAEFEVYAGLSVAVCPDTEDKAACGRCPVRAA
jgi:hypothetical protein